MGAWEREARSFQRKGKTRNHAKRKPRRSNRQGGHQDADEHRKHKGTPLNRSALRSYTGERVTRDHRKHQGTPARQKNTREPKEHKTRNSLPKCCERPAAREQKAKENITKIPRRSLPQWYQKPPKIDQKTSQNDTK